MKADPRVSPRRAADAADEFAFPVLQIGAAARRALAVPGPGTVLAVFERSVYVETARGALACLGGPGLGAGPLNARAALPEGTDWRASGLRPGAAVRCDGQAVRIAGRFVFSLDRAEAWRPERAPADWTARHLGDGLNALGAALIGPLRPALIGPLRPTGLGVLMPGLLAGTLRLEAQGIALPGDEPWLAVAVPAVRALTAWLREALRRVPHRGRSPPPDSAAALIGLGPGLTPSGDDFLAGMSIALHVLGRTDLARALARWALGLAEAGTGKISRAHLVCAADGEGAAPLHAALAALARPGAPGLAEALGALDALGHSSGWDGLAGAVAACAALVAAAPRAQAPSAALSR